MLKSLKATVQSFFHEIGFPVGVLFGIYFVAVGIICAVSQSLSPLTYAMGAVVSLVLAVVGFILFFAYQDRSYYSNH